MKAKRSLAWLAALAGTLFASALPAADTPNGNGAEPSEASAAVRADAPSSLQLERELQRLNWDQFRTVIRAVPKLKADVDAYGPLGWQYVHENYKTYGWKRNIDKLDDERKRQLAELIQKVKGGG